MEWKLTGAGAVPTGFESVRIDENNLPQHREVIRDLVFKALEGGTIKVYRKTEITPSENETENDDSTTRNTFLDQTKEWIQSPDNDVNKEDNWGFTKLMLAARKGETEACKMLIAAGADLEKVSKEDLTTLLLEDDEDHKIGGCTALQYAAMCCHKSENSIEPCGHHFIRDPNGGHLKTCEALISAGANLSAETPGESGYGGYTALHYAAHFGHHEICQALVSAGADVKKKSADGLPLLMIALQGPPWDNYIGWLVNWLALMDPEMIKTTMSYDNALTCAVARKCADLIELFIQLGADLDKEDKEGWTPLTKAAYTDNWDLCDRLLEAGASLDKAALLDSKEPTTALMVAVNEGHEDVSIRLLNAGANTDNIPKEKLEIIKKKLAILLEESRLGWLQKQEEYSNKDNDKKETDLYDNCKSINEAETLTDACNLKINKLDDNAMTYLLEKCKNLVSAGADVDEKGKKERTALLNAASHGYTEVCEMLIEAGADVHKGEALAEAMENGHAETCQVLIYAEAPIPYNDVSDDSGYTALMHAARYDMVDICRLLTISMGDSIEAQDEGGETALMKAAYWGSAEACRFLISAGASIEKEDKNGNTALMKALSRDSVHYIDIYKQLISAGANVDKRDSEGYTPLMKTKQPEICQLLISEGADVNLQSLSGETALMKAAKESGIYVGPDTSAAVKVQKEICKILIEAGADINIEIPVENVRGGWTAINWTLFRRSDEIYEMLISEGADINKETADGRTLLMHAAEKNWDLCSDLISRGADMNKKDKEGWTPLMITMNYEDFEIEEGEYEKKEMCSKFISLGADIKTETMPNGKTLLTCAAGEKKHFADICEILVLRGADVNKEDKDGWTPLMKAAWAGDLAKCQLFISLGASVDKEVFLDGKKTETAFTLSAKKYLDCFRQEPSFGYGHYGYWVCNILVSAGANILSTTYQ